jgi:hypothetical protein
VLSISLPTSRVLSPRQLRRRSSSRLPKRAKSLKRLMVRTYLPFFPSHLFSLAYTRKILSGKATFFVSNQDNLDALPEHKVKGLEEETETLAEHNKAQAAEVKAASAGMCALPLPCSKQRGARLFTAYTGHKRALAFTWLIPQSSRGSRVLQLTPSLQHR